MSTKWVLEIERVAQGQPHSGYYPMISRRKRSPGVDVDMQSQCLNQQAAIDAARRKLTDNVSEGDTIEYDGQTYSSVADAIEAITKDAPNWKIP